MHHVRIGAAHGAEQQPVAHRAAVDDEMDVARGAAVIGRQPDLAEQAQVLASLVDRHGIGGEIGAEHARGAPREPVLAVRLRRIGRRGQVVAGKREADLRVRHGKPAHDLGDRLRLGPVGFEELQPRRRRGEELGDLDPRALRRRRRPHRRFDAGLDQDRGPGRGVGGAGDDRKPRHGADRRQRLAAKAERPDARKVAVGQLRGRVALDRELEVLRGHAGAVVDDADEPASAALDRDLDRAGAGVDRVLDQFLHRRRRTLDHLAGRDAVDEDGIEAADGHQRLRTVFPGLAEGESPEPMTANAPDDDARKPRR